MGLPGQFSVTINNQRLQIERPAAVFCRLQQECICTVTVVGDDVRQESFAAGGNCFRVVRGHGDTSNLLNDRLNGVGGYRDRVARRVGIGRDGLVADDRTRFGCRESDSADHGGQSNGAYGAQEGCLVFHVNIP